jgi:hypothetical protein
VTPRRSGIARKLVWIMGSPRSGSTWLMQLLTHGPRVRSIREPLIGCHLGAYAPAVLNVQPSAVAGRKIRDFRPDAEYFFAEECADRWAPELERLIGRRFAAQLPRRLERCIVNEPNGSEGADIIMRAMRTSSLVFLLRDGRDVIDSVLDARAKGSWLEQAFDVDGISPRERLRVIEEQANLWVARIETTARAYEHHAPQRRWLVRYEDLRSDTANEIRRMYLHFGWALPPGFDRHVANLSFEKRPQAQRGHGKFHRAASPGLWRQNLTAEEQEACNWIMGPTLEQFGYQVDDVYLSAS